MEMMNMKALKADYSRRPDERAKFNYLLRLLVRVKGKTGRPSGEIVSALLTKGREEINWNIPGGL